MCKVHFDLKDINKIKDYEDNFCSVLCTLQLKIKKLYLFSLVKCRNQNSLTIMLLVMLKGRQRNHFHFRNSCFWDFSFINCSRRHCILEWETTGILYYNTLVLKKDLLCVLGKVRLKLDTCPNSPFYVFGMFCVKPETCKTSMCHVLSETRFVLHRHVW